MSLRPSEQGKFSSVTSLVMCVRRLPFVLLGLLQCLRLVNSRLLTRFTNQSTSNRHNPLILLTLSGGFSCSITSASLERYYLLQRQIWLRWLLYQSRNIFLPKLVIVYGKLFSTAVPKDWQCTRFTIVLLLKRIQLKFYAFKCSNKKLASYFCCWESVSRSLSVVSVMQLEFRDFICLWFWFFVHVHCGS